MILKRKEVTVKETTIKETVIHSDISEDLSDFPSGALKLSVKNIVLTGIVSLLSFLIHYLGSLFLDLILGVI